MLVPVVSKTGKPLMPCRPARAKELMKKGKAVGKFKKGVFYIKLTKREDGETQEIVVGIDPGSKKEGFTIKSEAHTYLNIQADAITWVKDRLEARRNMRRTRRNRKTPCRKPRFYRARNNNFIPPSTKARWDWKLRICNWLCKLYPITHFVVEDIKAITKIGQRKWNKSFSPLEIGKNWFYEELGKLASISLKQGYETKKLRDDLGLKKTSQKISNKFEAHCVDSWVLANDYIGGHIEPDNKNILFIIPIQLHRRQLHRLKPEKGGKRKLYGGTRSFGFKRGGLVKHPKYGIVYVGGCMKNKISLHSIKTGKRLSQNIKSQDCRFITFNSWRIIGN